MLLNKPAIGVIQMLSRYITINQNKRIELDNNELSVKLFNRLFDDETESNTNALWKPYKGKFCRINARKYMVF